MVRYGVAPGPGPASRDRVDRVRYFYPALVVLAQNRMLLFVLNQHITERQGKLFGLRSSHHLMRVTSATNTFTVLPFSRVCICWYRLCFKPSKREHNQIKTGPVGIGAKVSFASTPPKGSNSRSPEKNLAHGRKFDRPDSGTNTISSRSDPSKHSLDRFVIYLRISLPMNSCNLLVAEVTIL